MFALSETYVMRFHSLAKQNLTHFSEAGVFSLSKFKCSLFYWNLRLYINFHTDKDPFSCLEFAVVKTNSDFFRFKITTNNLQ